MGGSYVTGIKNLNDEEKWGHTEKKVIASKEKNAPKGLYQLFAQRQWIQR